MHNKRCCISYFPSLRNPETSIYLGIGSADCVNTGVNMTHWNWSCEYITQWHWLERIHWWYNTETILAFSSFVLWSWWSFKWKRLTGLTPDWSYFTQGKAIMLDVLDSKQLHANHKNHFSFEPGTHHCCVGRGKGMRSLAHTWQTVGNEALIIWYWSLTSIHLAMYCF